MDVTEREYINLRIDALRREMEQALAALRREHETYLATHARDHAQTNMALDKADTALLTRFESVNEFRGQLKDQVATFPTREYVDERQSAIVARFEQVAAEYNRRLNTIEQLAIGIPSTRATSEANRERIETLERAQAMLAGRDRGVGMTWAFIVAAIGAAAVVAGLLTRWGG